MKTPIKSSVSTSVIGSFSGEVLDSNITNKNGLDITAEVMQNVFDSDDYKEGIENGWFIGFLGHPEDPDCQDFEHACIVMTDMKIEQYKKEHEKKVEKIFVSLIKIFLQNMSFMPLEPQEDVWKMQLAFMFINSLREALAAINSLWRWLRDRISIWLSFSTTLR